MTRYIPLHPHSNLHIDTHAALIDLFDTALARIQAGANLLDTLATITLKDADERDLNRVAVAAGMLISDGLEVLEVVRARV